MDTNLLEHLLVQLGNPVEAEVQVLDARVAEGAIPHGRNVVPGDPEGLEHGAGEGFQLGHEVA